MDGQRHGLEAVIDFACYILIFGVRNCPEERSAFVRRCATKTLGGNEPEMSRVQ